MWNPVDPQTVQNPLPFWAWLRKEAPVWEVPDAGYFTVSRYADLVEVSRDSETFSSELLAIVQRDDSGRPRLLKTDLVNRPRSRVLGVADGEMHESEIAFIDEVGGKCVVKPLKGTHGRDVFMLRGSDADNLNQILDIMTRSGHVIAQEFIPEAVEGDVRLILLDGDLLEIDGHVAAVARVPGSGDFRSNIHAGGRARAVEPTPLMREAAVVVGERLRQDGIFLAGADFIGGKLVEVNTFSPGGLLDSERFYGVEFTAHIIERALEKAAEHRV